MTESDDGGWLPDPRDISLEFIARCGLFVGVLAGFLMLILALPMWLTYGMILGLLLIPLLSYMGVGYSLGGALGDVCWRVATLASGGHVLEYQSNGNYERHDWGEVEVPEENVFRMWNAPFGVTFEREPAVFDEYYRPAPDEVKTQEGAIIGNLERATSTDSQKGYIDADKDAGELWVQTPALAEMQFTSQKETTDEARDHAIEEYGGNTAQMANKTFALMVMACFVAGLVVGLLFA